MQHFAWISIASYGTGAAAFGIFALLLLTIWRERPLGTALATACAVNALWLALLALWPLYPMLPWQGIVVGEAVRDGTWLFLLARLLHGSHRRSKRSALLMPLVILAPLVWSAWILLPSFFSSTAALRLGMPNALISGGLGLSIVGLVLLEQFCRNLVPERRWALKFLCIGLGVQLGYDLLLYSDGLLYHRLDPAFWAARGAVAALTVPLLAVTAARNPSWSGNVFISRRIVFHTATLLGTGAYLLTISAGGYYIRYMGGTWGGFWQILFSSGAAIVLLVLLTSGQMRARLKVFLNKHFHTYKYDYREEWNRLIHRLYRTSDSSSAYERVIHALAEIVDSPGGGIWAKRDSIGRYAAVAHWNMGVPAEATEPLDSPFVRFVNARRWIIDADDRKHPGLEPPEWLKALSNWWLVVPLIQESNLIAFVVLARSRAPRVLDWEDRDLLKAAGQQLAAYLAQHEAAQSLTQARQFQAFNQLTTFLMHDLKNLIAQQSLMVKNAAKHKQNPAFIDDMIATIEDSVRRMTQLLEQLRSGHESGPKVLVHAVQIVRKAAENCSDRLPAPRLSSPPPDDELLRVAVDPHAFAMVLQHVIRNAQDATPDDGEICVKIEQQNGFVLIEVADSGSGMTPEFIRERLFTPFDSTKASRGMGIGAYQVRAFARQNGGDVEVESTPGAGTRFRIRLPQAQEPSLAMSGETHR